jgi:hypothetical protein
MNRTTPAPVGQQLTEAQFFGIMGGVFGAVALICCICIFGNCGGGGPPPRPGRIRTPVISVDIQNPYDTLV